ncbi:MAG: LPS export ABC transporter periplasmic protein LptC [Prevotellaceae bacterium]|jgi:LPS export ABC transporter protein LptC|nr:LPS export ABC transporter periplasmic protein LptC [Prevotellaceae bacterium]
MRHLFGAEKVLVALIFIGATVFVSCKEKIEKTDVLILTDSISTLTVHDMTAVETKFGKVSNRMFAPLKETFTLVEEPFEVFPNGIKVLGYTPEGEVETEITANRAVHKMTINRERWEVYGNVVVINHLKNETLKTDTLYWDQTNKRIYTDAFVQLFSPLQGFMQGFGMETDERANSFVILRPFDSYGVISNSDLE